MKQLLVLTLLACGLAFGQEVAKPTATPSDPVVKALTDENAWLKAKVEQLQLKIALMNAINNTNNQLSDLEAKKPQPQAIPIEPKAKP